MTAICIASSRRRKRDPLPQLPRTIHWSPRKNAPTTRRSRRPLTVKEEEERSLGRRARQLATRIDEIGAAITEREAATSELEVMFADPEQFADRTQLEDTGERYRTLKEEEQSPVGRNGSGCRWRRRTWTGTLVALKAN